MDKISRQTKIERYIEELKNNIEHKKYEVLSSIKTNYVFAVYIKSEKQELSFIGKVSPEKCPDAYPQGNAFYIPFYGSFGLQLKASLYQPRENDFILSLFHNRRGHRSNPLIRIFITGNILYVYNEY